MIDKIFNKIDINNYFKPDFYTEDYIYFLILKTNPYDKKLHEKLYLIDFGLGFHSHKVEDKAVDLHLLQQALNAKHYEIADQCMTIILKNYKPSNYKLIISRISIIESRGRYKKKQ